MGKQLVIIGADFSAVAIGDAKVLSSLAITTPPTKTTYTQGESFDPTGMVVRATYTDGTTSTSINYTYSPTILNIVGSQVITVSYTAGGVTQTATYTVTVQQGTVTYYTISGSITDGTLSGATSVADGGSANVTIVPSSDHTYPAAATDITVTGATRGTYNASTGALTITNATGNVTITATCPAVTPTTYTVSAVITNGTATSTSVASGGTATLTVTPNSGYSNPTSVTISSGTAGSATISGATITVTNVTSNIVLAATCPSSTATTRTLTYLYGAACSVNGTSVLVNPGSQTNPVRNGGVIHLNAGDIVEPKTESASRADFYLCLVSSWSSGTTGTCLTKENQNSKPQTDAVAAGSLLGDDVTSDHLLFCNYRAGSWKFVAPYECVLAFTSKEHSGTSALTSADIDKLLITSTQTQNAGGFNTVNSGNPFSYTYPTS